MRTTADRRHGGSRMATAVASRGGPDMPSRWLTDHAHCPVLIARVPGVSP